MPFPTSCPMRTQLGCHQKNKTQPPAALKNNRSWVTVSSVLFHCPRYISGSIVVPLQCQLYPVHIDRAFGLCSRKIVAKIMDTAVYGILGIFNAVRLLRILLVVAALRCLHRVFAFASWLLHHDSLNKLGMETSTMWSMRIIQKISLTLCLWRKCRNFIMNFLWSCW